MDHAVESSEPGVRGGDGCPHLLEVGDVRLDGEHLGAFVLDLAQPANDRTDAVVLVVGREPVVPLGAVGDRRAADEHQPGMREDGELACQLQADPPEAAGDQVDAAPPEG